MFKQASGRLQNQSFNLPAPVAGLDATSPLMQMASKKAVLLENWFPRPDALETRPGCIEHVTDLPDPPKRFHTYNLANGGQSLFVSTDSGLYDVTTAGVAGATVMALAEGDVISTLIATGAGHYMLFVNGVDTLKQYDGTTWSSVATLGAIPTTDYDYVTVYRQRVFLVRKNSLEIDYLAANSISGAPTNYPFGAVFKQGGKIVAAETWTIDGGNGPEDNLAIMSSTGHIAVFAGADPTTWSYKGTYFIGRPLGKTPLQQYGGDLLCLTETGIIPLSTAVQSTSIDRSRAFTQDIRPIFNAAASLFSANHGWEILVDPLTPMVLINIPSTPVRKQAVMHSQTGAWTFYSGWDSQCFGKAGPVVYYATATTIFRVGGISDDGANIVATFSQAYNRFGMSANKCAKLVRAYLTTTGSFEYTMGFSSNFQNVRELTYLSRGPDAFAYLWGTAIFGEALWSGATEAAQDWQTVPDEYTLWKSFQLQVITNNGKVDYSGVDMLLTPGGNF